MQERMARSTSWRVLLVLVVALLMALTPAWVRSAQADEPDTVVPVWVGGTQLEDGTAYTFGDGTVEFDGDTGVLTLTNATIPVAAGPAAYDDGFYANYNTGILCALDQAFEVKLVGDNKIVYDGAALTGTEVAGIFAKGIPSDGSGTSQGHADVAITGEGTLDIVLAGIPEFAGTEYTDHNGTPGYPTLMSGIHTQGASGIAIASGTTVSIELGTADTISALRAYGMNTSFVVIDSATVRIDGAIAQTSSGISAMQAGALGDADLTIDIPAGAVQANGASGSKFIASDEAQVSITTHEVLARGACLNCAVVEFGGRSQTKLVSMDVMVSADPTPAQGSWAINCGALYARDAATLEAIGATGAFQGSDAYLDGHEEGGAIVSERFAPIPVHSYVWDGTTPLATTIDGDGLYHYIRIPGEPATSRIAGDYANETAAAISASTFFESEWVVIARDDDFADALGATGLAGVLECPIVLTDRFGLSEAAAAEVERLGATKAFIIGGTGAIKDQVDADLAELGVAVEPRIWGENSYDTSLACAKKIVELGGEADAAIVAVSFNFQDALSISPVAYRYGAPIVLQTWGDTAADRGFTDEAAEWLGSKELIVVGGTGAISNESLMDMDIVARLWGEDGYETSNAIAEFGTKNTGWFTTRDVVFACGAQAPKGTDALAGAALAGTLKCPILLVNGNDAMEPVATTTIDGYFTETAGTCINAYILGGAYVMPDDIVATIVTLLAE